MRVGQNGEQTINPQILNQPMNVLANGQTDYQISHSIKYFALAQTRTMNTEEQKQQDYTSSDDDKRRKKRWKPVLAKETKKKGEKEWEKYMETPQLLKPNDFGPLMNNILTSRAF